MAVNNGKDVIYVDVDDEITTIIDKAVSSPEKIVALVLPKRASVFQSIVNMKLLKRRADSAKKQLVLITSEAGLLPLAGSSGIYVASTLQSKPEIPAGPTPSDLPDDLDEDEPATLPNEDFDTKKNAAKSVGELAGGAAAGAALDPDDTIELDNSELPDGAPAATPKGAAGSGADVAAMAAAGGSGKSGKKGKKAKKDKNLSVPNFERFRLVIVIAIILIILLIVGWLVASKTLAKAVVTIKTVTSSVNASITPTLSTTASSVNTTSDIVPASMQQLQKSYTQQVSATGQQNNGQKATGSVTMSMPCSDAGSQPTSIPAGTGISANGLTFTTDTAAELTNQSGSIFSSNCTLSSSATSVTAQQGGSQYNIQPTTFSVAGYSDVTATSTTPMTGGTDQIQTVVQQSDIDNAQQKLSTQVNKGAAKSQLEQTLQGSGEYPIVDSFTSSTPNSTSSAQVGTATSNVTVTEIITYYMYGARKSDLQQLINSNVDQQINTNKQAIQADGFNGASITVPTTGTGNTLQISIQSTATVGPQLNLGNLKQQIEGMKSGQVQSLIGADPGVQGVTVKFSPFWIDSVPKNVNKITFDYQKA